LKRNTKQQHKVPPMPQTKANINFGMRWTVLSGKSQLSYELIKFKKILKQAKQIMQNFFK